MYMQIRWMSAVALVMILAGCGSGSGGGGGGGTGGGSSTVAMKTAGLLPGDQLIGALQLTLSIPDGVTTPLPAGRVVQLHPPQPGEPYADAIKLTGSVNPSYVFIFAQYTPATQASSGTLKFQVLEADGFKTGQFIDVQLDVTPGYLPKSADFSLSDFAVSDLNGNVITTLTPDFDVEIK